MHVVVVVARGPVDVLPLQPAVAHGVVEELGRLHLLDFISAVVGPAELLAAFPSQLLVQLDVRSVHEELSFCPASTDKTGKTVVRPAHQLAASRLIVTLVELPDQRRRAERTRADVVCEAHEGVELLLVERDLYDVVDGGLVVRDVLPQELEPSPTRDAALEPRRLRAVAISPMDEMAEPNRAVS